MNGRISYLYFKGFFNYGTPSFVHMLKLDKIQSYVEVRQNTIITNYIGEYQILIKHHINNTSFLFCAISSLFLCFMLLFC